MFHQPLGQGGIAAVLSFKFWVLSFRENAIQTDNSRSVPFRTIPKLPLLQFVFGNVGGRDHAFMRFFYNVVTF